MNEEIREHLRVLAKELRWVANHIDEIADAVAQDVVAADEELVAKNQLTLFDE